MSNPGYGFIALATCCALAQAQPSLRPPAADLEARLEEADEELDQVISLLEVLAAERVTAVDAKAGSPTPHPIEAEPFWAETCLLAAEETASDNAERDRAALRMDSGPHPR